MKSSSGDHAPPLNHHGNFDNNYDNDGPDTDDNWKQSSDHFDDSDHDDDNDDDDNIDNDNEFNSMHESLDDDSNMEFNETINGADSVSESVDDTDDTKSEDTNTGREGSSHLVRRSQEKGKGCSVEQPDTMSSGIISADFLVMVRVADY